MHVAPSTPTPSHAHPGDTAPRPTRVMYLLTAAAVTDGEPVFPCRTVAPWSATDTPGGPITRAPGWRAIPRAMEEARAARWQDNAFKLMADDMPPVWEAFRVVAA